MLLGSLLAEPLLVLRRYVHSPTLLFKNDGFAVSSILREDKSFS